MTVGYSASKGEVDSTIGMVALNLREAFDAIRHFKIWLDAKPDADLTTMGYTANDIATLRSAYVDLLKLANIYEGTATQSPAYDFRTFAKLLTGVS